MVHLVCSKLAPRRLATLRRLQSSTNGGSRLGIERHGEGAGEEAVRNLMGRGGFEPPTDGL